MGPPDRQYFSSKICCNVEWRKGNLPGMLAEAVAHAADGFDEVFRPVRAMSTDSGPPQNFARQFTAAEHEIRRQREIGYRNQTQNPRDGDRRRTTLVFRARGQDIDEHTDDDDE